MDEQSAGTPNVDVAASEVAEAPSQPEAPKDAPKAKFKLSTGEEIEESELLSRHNYVKAANERFQSAAAERKAASEERAKIAEEKAAAEALYQKFKDNPWKVMEELGLNPDDLAEARMIERIQQEALTPEQKRIKELEEKTKSFEQKEKERLKAEEDRKKAEEEAAKIQENEKLTIQAKADYEQQFLKALENTSLPKTPASIRRVAEKIYQSALAGDEIPVEHAIRLAEHEFRTSLSELVQGLDAEALEELLGEETLKKVRKHDVSKLKNPIPTPKADAKSDNKPDSSKTPAYIDSYEWRKAMKKKHGIL